LAEIAITVSHMIDPNTLPSAMQQAVGSLRNIQDMPVATPFLFGTALTVAGGFIRWWCFRTLGRFFTFKLSVREEHQLVTSGPYAVVRHPSYMGGIIMSLGTMILYGSSTSLLRRSGVMNVPGMKPVVCAWLAWRMLALSSYVGRINQEDEVLKSIAGDEWHSWARVVRYKLLPGIY
jgi:protein-S-isoprenylcysteine O-methyltransferase Ste14